MSIFDNATSVVIGNKEVQSIVRVSDGAVLYQKAQTHSYALAFSSATYQTDSNGDVTVSVTLTDNGVAVSGQSVSFNDGTSAYTSNTNNNGVATLQYNCQVNKTLTATYSNVSASCSVVSNYVPSVVLAEPITYTVIDNTSSGSWEAFWIPCEDVGSAVTSISELSNPPMTQQELLDYWGEYHESFPGNYHEYCMDGEMLGELECEQICYVIATEDYENWLTVTYSSTTGSDITITVSD